MIAIIYHEKPSICNVCLKFHDNQSVHCWDIAFYKKMVENCRRQHCQLTRARNARQYRRQRTVRQRLRNFCMNKNKMVT